ncbi:hypothetical protein C0995_010312, partial [Termitomyces sp. Mi166
MAKCIKLVQAAKAFLEQQGKLSQFFVLEGYKGKGKAKALLGDSEKAGAKRSFKLMELVDSDSDEEEEDRVYVIKKIKREHVEEPMGARKNLFPSQLLLAGPSTAPIVPSSAPKPAAAAALSKPMPAKSAGPAVKGGSIVKDPFMVRHFKLAGTEESGALIVNQATEVPATQETLREEESSDEDNENGQGDNDNSDEDNVAMDVDSAKRPEKTQSVAPMKTTVTKVVMPVPAPVPPTKPKSF